MNKSRPSLTAGVLWLLRFYQSHLSPLTPPCCRFRPTCSAYAIQAISAFGLRKGGYLAVKRLLRCHPFHKDSTIRVDPVPDQAQNSTSPS